MRKLLFSLLMCAVYAGEHGGRRWSWPEDAADSDAAASSSAVRIDTKVQFHEPTAAADVSAPGAALARKGAPFQEATDTEGFYNRPGASGRYPVRSLSALRLPFPVDGSAVYPIHDRLKGNNDGTPNSSEQCKCVSTPDCNPRPNSLEVCGVGKWLCCFKRPSGKARYSEFFNEIDDERPMLFPGKEKVAGPFPPPPNSLLHGEFGPGHGHEAMVLGALEAPGLFNNDHLNEYGGHVLARPGGSGAVKNPRVLVGSGGPSYNGRRDVGTTAATAQRPVLVGIGGPTGIIGPYSSRNVAARQRGVLVGPGGPTGIIGPGRTQNTGVLVGPGGPTGRVGPPRGTALGSGVLVGPGGPTGIIGPGRQLLVGPGGPTGRIGPPRYFGN